jgi:hypothetical protein
LLSNAFNLCRYITALVLFKDGIMEVARSKLAEETQKVGVYKLNAVDP